MELKEEMAADFEEQQFPEPEVFVPPGEGEFGDNYRVLCSNYDCQYPAEIEVSPTVFWIGPLAKCPICGANMHCDPATINISIQARGAGAHDGTIGDRKKRMMRERSDNLAKKQWDNVEPIKVPEGRKIRNPTAGGPYDPNGPFAKKKPKQQIFLPKGAS